MRCGRQHWQQVLLLLRYARRWCSLKMCPQRQITRCKGAVNALGPSLAETASIGRANNEVNPPPHFVVEWERQCNVSPAPRASRLGSKMQAFKTPRASLGIQFLSGARQHRFLHLFCSFALLRITSHQMCEFWKLGSAPRVPSAKGLSARAQGDQRASN